jgi:60 kDa SS-A/Ro ribonucleoprotein
MSATQLAYQVVKYQQRNGWSHRDLLRLTHAKAKTPQVNDVLHYAVKGWESIGEDAPWQDHLRQIWAFEKAKQATTAAEVVTLIERFDLPRECVPTQFLKDKTVWAALLQRSDGRVMPMTAMIRNLATMSRVGLLTPMSEAGKVICQQLTNEEAIKRARVHPIQLLSALRVYAAGGTSSVVSRSKGESFEPLAQVKAALEKAFYLSFGTIEPTGKRTLLALDVSGSMGQGEIAGVPGLTPREAEAAMAMVTARSEWSTGDVSYPLYHSVAFDTGMTPIALAPTDSLEAVTKRLSTWSGGGTDCSLPMKYALEKNILVDTFIIYTDNETWAGRGHPSEALKTYRAESKIPARLVVVGLTATEFSIADPADSGMLDVVGFDASAPSLIAQFARGDI